MRLSKSCYHVNKGNVLPSLSVKLFTKQHNEQQKLNSPPIFPNLYAAEVINFHNQSLGYFRENYHTWQTVDKIITPRLKNYTPAASSNTYNLIQQEYMNLIMLLLHIRFWHQVKILNFLHQFKHFLKCTAVGIKVSIMDVIYHVIIVYGAHMQRSHSH